MEFDDIDSVTLSSKAISPKCKEKVPLADAEVLEFLDCTACNRSFKLKIAQFEIPGYNDVNTGSDELVTLTINNVIVDQVFGEGTSHLYCQKTKELKKKLLCLENLPLVILPSQRG